MEETTKEQLGNYISQLVSKAEWRKPLVPSIDMQGNATVVARPPEAGPKLPVRKIQEHATAAGDGEQTATRHDSITGTEWLATAPAPAPGSNNQLSLQSIDGMRSIIEQIKDPVLEDHIKDFVKGGRFRSWLTSDDSDALVVNSPLAKSSSGAEGVSLLTEFTLLLYEQLSTLPNEVEAFSCMYLCAQWPATIGNMTTMRHLLRYLTSELYGNDCEHWDKQDFVHEFSKGIRERVPANDNGDEKNHLLVDFFIEMLQEAQQGQVVYILIDGFDLVERDKSRVNQWDYWQFLTCLYDSIEDLNNADSRPAIKLLITYHETCPKATRDYWGNFVADLAEPPKDTKR